MSILNCYLAAEKKKDGKPFIVCEVGTWYYVSVHMARADLKDTNKFNEEMKRIYNLFDNGKDHTERGVTLEELKELKSNGGISIISKNKYKLIKTEDWGY